MSCWAVLRITPTRNIDKIKKAYIELTNSLSENNKYAEELKLAYNKAISLATASIGDLNIGLLNNPSFDILSALINSSINDSEIDSIDKFINEEVDCVCYNLGYLPGGNKEITTLAETSLKSIQLSLNLLSKNGIISIAIYRGHNEGMEEKNCIIKYLKTLPKNSFGVMIHECINRSEKSPLLIIVEKK